MSIFLQLFLTFFKIGLFTFGGGYAMLPLMQAEVEAHNWLESSQLVNFIAVSESTPGPFAVNMATYIGMTKGGLFGAFCATLGVVLPSFLVILIVAKCYAKFKESTVVAGCMSGLRPAVVGLIASALITVAQTVFFSGGLSLSVFSDISFYVCLVIFAAAVVAAFKKVHPIIIICSSAAVGIAAGYIFNIKV